MIRFWRWLNKDAEIGAMPSLASVSGEFTAAEHAFALFIRALFMVSELALIGAAFTSIVLFFLMYMQLGFPMALVFLCGIGTPAVLYLFVRKGHGALRAWVFDTIRRRAAARQARDVPPYKVALDSAAATGGAPVAVSVDVDHEEHQEHARK